MNSLELKVATLADLPVLTQLYAEMDGKSPLTLAEAEEVFQAIATLPNYRIYLALWHGQPVGTFSLFYVPTLMHPGFHRYAILDAVTVTPAYRSQGIGQAMMQAALRLCSEAGCYKVTLSSNLKRDRAHEFYKSLGFEQHGWSFSYQLP